MEKRSSGGQGSSVPRLTFQELLVDFWWAGDRSTRNDLACRGGSPRTSWVEGAIISPLGQNVGLGKGARSSSFRPYRG